MQDATTLAVDMAGFTRLTDRLAPWGSRGTEGLSRVLRRYFADVTDVVVAAGGDPVAFGGDGLTVVFDGPASATLSAARGVAARIEELTAATAPVPTPRGDTELHVRMGVARGPVATAVARSGLRLLPVHVGPGLDLAHAAQERAGPGSVALDDSVVAGPAGPDRSPGRHLPASDVPARLPDVEGLLPPVLLERLHHGLALGESHRVVTVAFVRYPPVAPGALGGFVGDVAELLGLVSAFGGEVVQVSGGDKGVLAMVVLGAPVAHADDAVRAVHAMLELRRHEPRTAVGVATGPVFTAVLGSHTRLFPTHTGSAVNLAARLSQAAAPGGVLIDERTWEGASRHLRAAGPAERHTLKGYDAPVLVRQVTGRRRARPPAATGLPLLVGRGAELARLEQLLDRAAAGRGGMMTIRGPAGIGKTRLAQEAVARARARGMATIRVDVLDHPPGPARGLWREVVAGLLGLDRRPSPSDLLAALDGAVGGTTDVQAVLGPVLGLAKDPPARPLGPEGERLVAERVQAGLDRVLDVAARTRPLLLALENADHFDALSADLLGGLGRVAGRCAVGVLVTRGDAPSPDSSPRDPTPQTILLGPLPDDEVGLLGEEAWRQAGGGAPPSWLARAVVARAAGNPLVARVTARTLVDRWRPGEPPPDADVHPGPVADLVAAQVDRLPADARQLLTVLAIARRPCTVDLLAELLGPTESPSSVRRLAHRLVAEQLVAASDDGSQESYRISHDLLSRAVHDATSHAVRDRLHRALVDRLGDGAPDPVEVAEHVHQLRDPALGRQWYGEAARAARSSWDLQGARVWLERLRELVDGRERQRVELELLEVLLIAGRPQEVLARAELDPTLETGRPAAGSVDPDLLAPRLLVLAEAAYGCGRLRRTERVARQVMRLADGRDERRYLRAGELLTLALCDQGDLVGGLRVGQELAARAAHVADPAGRAAAWSALAVALVLSDRPEDAARRYHDALAAATESLDEVRQIHILSDLAGCAFLTGDHSQSVALLARARGKAEAVGYRRHLALSLSNEARLRAALGDAYAAACMAAAAQRSLEVGDLSLAADLLQAWLTVRPSLAADRELWQRLAVIDRRLGRDLEAAVDLAELAVVLARAGQGDAARRTVDEVEGAAPEQLPRRVSRRTTFARLLADARDPEPGSATARDRALADLDELARDPTLSAVEAAEVAVERWRLRRGPDTRAAAVRAVRAAYASEPSAVVRGWWHVVREPLPAGPEPLPPPAGITRARTTRRDLERAFADVEAALAT